MARLGTAALLLGSLVLAFVLAEAVARVARYGSDALWPSVARSLHPIGTSGLVQPSSPNLVYELQPDLDVLYKKVRFRTNSFGMRDRHYARPKPLGTFRVAVVGDSLTMGTGVVIEEVYHARLERSFNDEFERPRFEFLNFGVSGYQLPQYLAVIEEKVPAWEPDLILIGLSSNDHIYLERARRSAKGPYRVKPVTNPFFEIHLVPWIQSIGKNARRGAGPEARLAPAFRDHLERYLARIAAATDALGVPALLVYLNSARHPFGRVIDAIAEIAAETGLPFVDASSAFPNLPHPRFWIYPADGHPNGAAHALFAERLGRELRERDLLPLEADEPRTEASSREAGGRGREGAR